MLANQITSNRKHFTLFLVYVLLSGSLSEDTVAQTVESEYTTLEEALKNPDRMEPLLWTGDGTGVISSHESDSVGGDGGFFVQFLCGYQAPDGGQCGGAAYGGAGSRQTSGAVSGEHLQVRSRQFREDQFHAAGASCGGEEDWGRAAFGNEVQEPPAHWRDRAGDCAGARSHCDPHSVVEGSRNPQSKHLFALHLHPRDAGGTQAGHAGQLRLCQDALRGCGLALRNGGQGGEGGYYPRAGGSGWSLMSSSLFQR